MGQGCLRADVLKVQFPGHGAGGAAGYGQPEKKAKNENCQRLKGEVVITAHLEFPHENGRPLLAGGDKPHRPWLATIRER